MLRPALSNPCLVTTVLALAGPALRADRVVVEPGDRVVEAGGACHFTARLVRGATEPRQEHKGEDKAAGLAWTWRVLGHDRGTITPHTGEYTAPQLKDHATRRAVIEATAPSGAKGTARVLVVPRKGADRAGTGESKGEASGARVVDAPYLRPDDRRVDADATVQLLEGLDRTSARRSFAGPGMPSLLHWDALPGVGVRILTYRDGGRWVQRDVTGLESVTVRPAGFLDQARVENLYKAKDGGFWVSQVRRLDLHQTGVAVLPLAAAVPPRDGEDRVAPLRAPFGALAFKAGKAIATLVSDLKDDRLCLVDDQGVVRDFCGARGQPGFKDGAGDQARFNGPTYLARVSSGGRMPLPLGYLVADSGNFAIRWITPQGEARTLAGTGAQGHHDDPVAAKATFWSPRGIAVTPDGTVYVADKDTLRRIDRASDPRNPGGVVTVAGVHGEPGARDGILLEAQFTDLKGILLDQERTPRHLYVLDGHALRVVDLKAGRVDTLVGEVGQAGFGTPGSGGLKTPLLRDPTALAWSWQVGARRDDGPRLLISDTGNHAIQVFDLQARTLTCLAGDPDLPADHPGLLREHLPAGTPAGELWGGLGVPLGMAEIPVGRTMAYRICTAQGLVELREKPRVGEVTIGPAQAEAPAAVAGEAWVMPLTVPVWDEQGKSLGLALSYTLECLEPDGTPAGEPRKGKAATSQAFTLTGTFHQAGTAKVRVSMRLETGDLLRREWAVQVK